MKTVLAAVDFSVICNQVLASAEELARDSNARVLLLHVVQIPATMFSFQLVGADVADLVAGMKRDALARLDTLRLQFPGLEVLTLAAVGRPADEISRATRQHAADVVIVGSHGHTALYEYLLGSTTRELLAQAECPVIVIPHRAAAAEAAADCRAEVAAIEYCLGGR